MTKKVIIITLLGVIVGAVLGYTYYYFVGCSSGTCSITSKPLNSTLYGAILGGLLFNSISDYLKKNKI
jgi:type III secretory pathway component EscU